MVVSDADCSVVGPGLDSCRRHGCLQMYSAFAAGATLNSRRTACPLMRLPSFKMEVAYMSKDKTWANLNKNPSWVPGPPCKAAAAHFRLLIWNNCLRFHLFSIGITDSPNCTV
ncbi:hypothetical protein TNCV_583131 [Trichonephila clavipes]|nr:hypothetical protein TNCV_583131 [Trichonephila clavipes]